LSHRHYFIAAHHYILRCAIEDPIYGSTLTVIDQSQLGEGRLGSPNESGVTEQFTILFSEGYSGKNLTFTVIAVDEAGNQGESSDPLPIKLTSNDKQNQASVIVGVAVGLPLVTASIVACISGLKKMKDSAKCAPLPL